MVKYSTKRAEPITEENILKRTTEYDIYSYYIGSSFIVGSKFNSPLRKDKSPSFGIFVSRKTNSLLFKDQSTGIVGNCFKFVQLKENLNNYKQALELVSKDLNLDLLVQSKKGLYVSTNYKASKTIIQIKNQNFTSTDLKYWESYNISRRLLKKYNVYSISHV